VLRNCCARFVIYVERKNPKRVLQNWCVRFVNYVEQKDKALVALSSIVMALFTVVLSIATILLWTGGERHSERELRAYVFPVEIKVENFKTQTPIVAFVKVENSGNTPAHKFTCYAKMVAGPLPQKDFSRPEEANLPASYLGPGEVMWFTPHGDRLLTAEESEAITQGTAAIYVFGEIRYVDAFGKRRHTTFRAIARGEHGYMHTEKDRKDVLRLSVDREGGNDAN
jgi:hypothetical protein